MYAGYMLTICESSQELQEAKNWFRKYFFWEA